MPRALGKNVAVVSVSNVGRALIVYRNVLNIDVERISWQFIHLTTLFEVKLRKFDLFAFAE